MIDILLPILGVLLAATVLLDVFLTVLYARIGTGIISHTLACLIWRLFYLASKLFFRKRDAILSFAGPAMLVLLVMIWIFGLMLGGAMVIYPKLGTSIVATSGPTPTDFVTALYVVGDGMTTVGATDFAPRTRFFRLFYTLASCIGISVLTLTMTYLLEIYNALQRRNTFALKLHLIAGETADAAEIIAGIGSHGEFRTGYAHVAELAAEMVEFKESHHFYSVIFYFRFREEYYAVSRVALLSLDAVSLIKSAISDEKYAWFKESAAVAQLWRGSMHLLTLLATSFLPQGVPEDPSGPDEQTLERWRRRYAAALNRLREAEIETIEDEKIGLENYIALRTRWDRYIGAFARHMAHDINNIDLATTNPDHIVQPFQTRLRSAG